MRKLIRSIFWVTTAIVLSILLIVVYQFFTRTGTPLDVFLKPFQGLNAYTSIQSSNITNSSTSSNQAQAGNPASVSHLTSTVDGTKANVGLSSLVFPIRAAFYYPWFPEGWTQNGIYPYTNYSPTLGFYDLSDQSIIRAQIDAMIYGNIEAGIASWWGQGSPTDKRIPLLLAAAAGTNFKWTIYYEPEGIGNPDVATLASDLVYLRDHYSNDPGYLRIDNRFVVFAYADANDGCEMVDRWKQANTVNAYIVLKVFPGFQACSNQPDGWHQYAPANAEDSQGQYSFTISPGFWKVGENPRLVRDQQAWQQGIQDMVASGANFQLITSFNEWGEGTAIESASQWNSPSEYGTYLDALHTATLSYRRFLPTVYNLPVRDPVIIGAGDIAACDSPGDEQTAAILKDIPATVITLGDNAYESGSIKDYQNCYNPSWGLFKADTFPVAGNHDYLTLGASGYFDYFGAAAGDPSKGYYSYDIGQWHIIALNSDCSEVGGCGLDSPQVAWLQADLAAHPSLCTLAYWHHPLFSSGQHGNTSRISTFWQVLYQAGAELVLNGHDHDYERFAPQSPSGLTDPAHGIREFVVGTGGKNLTSIGSLAANSKVHNDSTWGVLMLTLHPTAYDWQFIPVAGQSFTDSGSGVCH